MQDTDNHRPAFPDGAGPAQVRLDPARLAAWLRLVRTPGVGPRTVVLLLAAFGSLDAVLHAGHDALRGCVGPGLATTLATALARPPAPDTTRLLDTILQWQQGAGHSVLALDEPAYPPLLAQIPDPPPLLYIRGDLRRLARPALAIVGSRNASTQGRANAHAFAQALAGAGLTIVSGLALGIDAAAHEGALAAADSGRPGATIAVVGTGPDLVYPARNRALCERIVREGGCVVSEYPVGTPPLPSNFPKRNRIISGLCAGVLVVEAAAQSGSLITARQAAEQGRDVFAIPGSIHAALAKGCHLLIREGAKLVDTAGDVLEALAMSPLPAMAGGSAGAASSIPDGCAPLLAALGHDPVEPDSLLDATGGTAGELGGGLLLLELAGLVERLPDGRVQRVVQ